MRGQYQKTKKKNLIFNKMVANIYKETEEDIFLEIALEQLWRAWNMLQKWPFSCSKFFWYSQARAVWSWHFDDFGDADEGAIKES